MTNKTRTSGIYKININGKFYIGSSSFLENRLAKHRYKLKNRIHENKKFQQEFDECQEMQLEVLEYCDAANLLIIEQIYLDKFFGTDECLNIQPSAKGNPRRPKGYVLSKEARKSISEKMKGNTNGRFGKGIPRTMSAEARAKQIASIIEKQNKKVIATKPDGEVLMFESIKDAAETLGVPHRTMSNWTRGESKPTAHKDYIGWVFSQEDDSISQ